MKCKLSIFVLICLVCVIYGLNESSAVKSCGIKVRKVVPKEACKCEKDGKDGCDWLSCCEIETIQLWPETDEEANAPLLIQKEIIITVFIACLCGSTALFFNWWNAYTVLFTISRRLRILDKKITACQEKMNKRAFSDALIGKLAHAAHFDFTAAQKEADTMLNSMMTKPLGAPGSTPV